MASSATLQRNRPRDDSSETIQHKLAELDEERAAAERLLADATSRRAALLIGGSGDQIRDAGHQVDDARLALERVGARAADLTVKLSVAVGRERIGHVQALIAEAEAATQCFCQFWPAEYEVLAEKMRAGLALEGEARAARALAAQAASEASADADVVAAGGVPKFDLTPLPWAFVGYGGKSPSLLVGLPATEPGAAIHWVFDRRSERADVG